jgi:hypothetical protein
MLALELTGHGAVYNARKELALLRLVQAGREPTGMADTLRLLRHAAAKNELDLALSRLRMAGPLSVLGDDARQILRTRTSPELLRTVEMRVLHMAADLFAPAEARLALDAVRGTLDAGGPQDLPGRWELPVLRKETAWVSAAALGNACNAAGEVALLLLEEAAKAQKDDQLLDRALLRATAEIDWTEVSSEIQHAWFDLLRIQNANLPGTTEVISARLGRSAPRPAYSSGIDDLISRLNSAMRGGPVDPTLSDDIPLIRDALAKIRSDAERGVFSMGALNIADIAVGLVIVAGADELWPELTDFLLDPKVQRQDRTSAFERLARATVTLPEDVATRFSEQAEQLLTGASPELFDLPLSPYPAALRFLGAHQLVDHAEMYDKIAILAGSANPDGRREAAATVAVLAAKAPRGDLLALALPLTHDDNVEVRAAAGRALAHLAKPEEGLATVARRRLTELLAQDGVLVPLRLMQALGDTAVELPDSVRKQLASLSDQHPARSVRNEAKRLLNQESRQTELYDH